MSWLYLYQKLTDGPLAFAALTENHLENGCTCRVFIIIVFKTDHNTERSITFLQLYTGRSPAIFDDLDEGHIGFKSLSNFINFVIFVVLCDVVLVATALFISERKAWPTLWMHMWDLQIPLFYSSFLSFNFYNFHCFVSEALAKTAPLFSTLTIRLPALMSFLATVVEC